MEDGLRATSNTVTLSTSNTRLLGYSIHGNAETGLFCPRAVQLLQAVRRRVLGNGQW